MPLQTGEWLLGTRVALYQSEYHMEISKSYRNYSEED
jgi:hypothetical protein